MSDHIPAKIVVDPARVHELFRRYTELDKQARALMHQENELQREKKRIADTLGTINPTNLSPGEIVQVTASGTGKPWRGCVQSVQLNARQAGNGWLLEFVAVVKQIRSGGKLAQQPRRVPLGLIEKLRDHEPDETEAPGLAKDNKA